MLRMRKYFRGSGRALAFIFVASVIWLIFDMAALRLSLNEMNNKMSREELFRREMGGNSETWRRDNAPRGHGSRDSPKLKGVFFPPGDLLDDPIEMDAKVRFRQRKRIIKPMDLITLPPDDAPAIEVRGDHKVGAKKDIDKDMESKNENVMGAKIRGAVKDLLEPPKENDDPKDGPRERNGEAKEARAVKDLLGPKEEGAAHKMPAGKDEGSKEAEVNIVEVKEPEANNVLGVKYVGGQKPGAAQDVMGVKQVGSKEGGASKGVAKDIGSKEQWVSKDDGAKEADAPKDVGAKALEDKKVEKKEESVLETKEVGSKQPGAVKSALEVKEGKAAKSAEAKDVADKEEGAAKGVLGDKDKGANEDRAALKAKEVDAAEGVGLNQEAGVGAKHIGAKDGGAAKSVMENKKEGAANGVLEDKDFGGNEEGAGKGLFEEKAVEGQVAAAKGVLESRDVGAKEEGAAKGEPKKATMSKEDKGQVEAKELTEKLGNFELHQPPKDTVVIDKLKASHEKSQAGIDIDVASNHSLQQTSRAMDKNEKHLINDIRGKNSTLASREVFIGKSGSKEIRGTLAKDVNIHVNISTAIKADVENKQTVQQEKVIPATESRKHKVRALDVTQRPRDPNAPGQFGRAAAVPKDKEQEANKKWKEGNFNVYLSDLIPLDRAIEDTRPKGFHSVDVILAIKRQSSLNNFLWFMGAMVGLWCSAQLVHVDLPHTSVIICFVDEVWSTLLRTVMSVLNRSPPELIKEIILVDDFSTRAYLKEQLDEFMNQYPKVRILHLKERHGLIRARVAGANIATGDVLTFLDSHVECNVGWLEPLLEQVRVNRKKVACPVIEVINDKDMSYMTVDNFQRGIFTWPMNFGWKPIPPEVLKKNNITEMSPIKCPVMAGGLFSIDKKYFYELGTYDPGLDVWGGENMEISFKIWMCGGEIEIIPCSRVGHIFRNDNPYSFPKDRLKTVERNLARVAEVWLDEYKEIFYGHGYHLLQDLPNIGDLTPQKELRKKLQCKNFKWYIDNVFPDLEAPLVRASGLIKNPTLGKCLALQNTTVLLDDCNGSKQNQQFNFTWLRLIKQKELCIGPTERDNVAVLPCDNKKNTIRWLHRSLASFHPPLESHLILESIPQPTCLEFDPVQKRIRTNACNPSAGLQKWQFEQYLTP